ncbi:MAG: hypothetical protein ACX930_10990 [Erythrobacter sp.]
MATKSELRGAFGSLSDTLLWRFDPSASQPVRERWLGIVAQHASVARKTSKWRALADECAAYDPVIAALNESTAAIVTADSNPQRLAALDLASLAIAQTDTLLADNPCGQNQA